MKSFKWKKEKITKGLVMPPSREGHTITFLPHLNVILLFGGISNMRMNDLYFYDIKSNSWSLHQTTGRVPQSRCYHTVFFEEPYLFVYAGQGDKGRSLGDFYILNLKTFTWRRLFLIEAPPSRHHHTWTEITSGEKERVIFGGLTLPENILLNDIWTFNYSNLAYNSTLPEIPGGVCTLRKTKGDAPTPRKGHQAFNYNKLLYIFGGKTANQTEDTFQIHALNYETNTWKKVPTIGKPPAPRSFFTANLFSSNRLIIFGGLNNTTSRSTNETHILFLDDFYWSAPFTAGYVPSPRYHHASTTFTRKGEPHILILGGLESAICSMELCILFETSTKENAEWEPLREMNEKEQMIAEAADATIIDYKKYINELDNLIMHEKIMRSELDKEMEHLEEETARGTEEREKIQKTWANELQKLDSDNDNFLVAIESLFLLIKQEQIITKEIVGKNAVLESTLQKVQDYMINLDQFFMAVSKGKYDPNDNKEMHLSKILDSVKDEVAKNRDNHKEALYKLKKNYEKINSSLKKIEYEIESSKTEVFRVNKDYEQILLETEADEF